jgi:hypothetical protein
MINYAKRLRYLQQTTRESQEGVNISFRSAFSIAIAHINCIKNASRRLFDIDQYDGNISDVSHFRKKGPA